MFVSFFRINFDSSFWSSCSNNWKQDFLVLGILYPYFKSLGLDMTSVILNRFIKKGQQQAPYFVYDFFSFYQRIIQTLDSRMIDFLFKEFYNFKKISIVKLLERTFFFQYKNKKTYEVVPTYWFALTLDPYSCERNKHFLFSSSSILYSFLYSKKV